MGVLRRLPPTLYCPLRREPRRRAHPVVQAVEGVPARTRVGGNNEPKCYAAALPVESLFNNASTTPSGLM